MLANIYVRRGDIPLGEGLVDTMDGGDMGHGPAFWFESHSHKIALLQPWYTRVTADSMIDAATLLVTLLGDWAMAKLIQLFV